MLGTNSVCKLTTQTHWTECCSLNTSPSWITTKQNLLNHRTNETNEWRERITSFVWRLHIWFTFNSFITLHWVNDNSNNNVWYQGYQQPWNSKTQTPNIIIIIIIILHIQFTFIKVNSTLKFTIKKIHFKQKIHFLDKKSFRLIIKNVIFKLEMEVGNGN